MKKGLPDISQFIEAVVFVPSSMVDAVSSYVTDNIALGVELKESENAPLVGVKFYVQAADKNDFRPALNEYLSQLVSKEMPQAPSIKESLVTSQDWEQAYRESIQPVLIDNEICVRPPWAEAPGGVKFDIIIEPKMAFGTGHHETTRTCMQLIHRHFKKGQRLLDFGCGSGVLAILGDKLGAEFVKAVDCDTLAVDNCLDNFEINRVKCKYEVQLGSFNMIVKDAAYDMICANLTTRDIAANLNHLMKVLKRGGRLIISGILDNERSSIEPLFNKHSLANENFIHENEWLTYSLKK